MLLLLLCALRPNFLAAHTFLSLTTHILYILVHLSILFLSLCTPPLLPLWHSIFYLLICLFTSLFVDLRPFAVTQLISRLLRFTFSFFLCRMAAQSVDPMTGHHSSWNFHPTCRCQRKKLDIQSRKYQLTGMNPRKGKKKQESKRKASEMHVTYAKYDGKKSQRVVKMFFKLSLWCKGMRREGLKTLHKVNWEDNSEIESPVIVRLPEERNAIHMPDLNVYSFEFVMNKQFIYLLVNINV